MDEADQAKRYEQADRERALANQQRRARETERPLVIDGVRCCIGCGSPIPRARLAARPESVRCIRCKQEKERRQ